jgi:Uma2 family endonuclease
MSVPIERRVFTADEVYRMLDIGILSEDDRIELIEGDLVRMSPIGKSHAACVDRLNALLNRRCGDRAIVRVQGPIHIDDSSEPQPDVALLKPRPDFYAQAHPTPEDILLVIEVADSSVDYDRSIKIPLYARAGIPVAMLVDLNADRIEVSSEPENGTYKHRQTLGRGDFLSLASLSDLVLPAGDILG